MKKLLVLFLCLLLATSALAEEGESGVIAFGGAWPEMMLDAVRAVGCEQAVPMQGYASRRFGRWDYGQAVARDGNGYVLVCFVYGEDGWTASASRKALRQDEAPQLWVQAVAEEWDASQIASYGACYEFELIYDDARYAWFCGTYDWMLTRMVLPVANVVVTPRSLYWGEETVFNTQSNLLADIDIAALPTTLAEARALVDVAGLGDSSQALLTGGDDPYAPEIVMYAAPSRSANTVARYFSGVTGEMTDMGSGFVKLRIGAEEGWIPRENVLLGGERAQQDAWNGATGQVYACGLQRYQTLWQTPAEATSLATLETHVYLNVLGVLTGGDWLQVMLPDGLIGYMRSDAVSQTDNLRTAWVCNDLPHNRLHLRASPSTKAESYAKYYSGVPVTILFSEKRVDDWLRVAVADRAGWMSTEFLLFSSDPWGYLKHLPPMAAVRGVDAKGLNLRVRPDYSAEVIARYPAGTRVEIMGVVGSWAHVRLRDGHTGYMLLKHLGGEPEQAVLNEFAINARAFLMLNDVAVDRVESGDWVQLCGSRPWLEWTYTEDGMQLIEPAYTWVNAGTQYGAVPTACIDFGW